jgi:hypothetical protein
MPGPKVLERVVQCLLLPNNTQPTVQEKAFEIHASTYKHNDFFSTDVALDSSVISFPTSHTNL